MTQKSMSKLVQKKDEKHFHSIKTWKRIESSWNFLSSRFFRGFFFFISILISFSVAHILFHSSLFLYFDISQTTSRFGWHSPNDDELCKIDQSLPYMVKTSTYSPKVRPMNSKTTNRSSGGSSSHEKTTTAATSSAPYSKSVDAKYYSRAFDYTSSVKLSPRRDNSAVLRAVSASASSPNTSCFATASRLNKYRYHHQPSFETHEMFEQQTQPQPESNKQQNTFGKYEKELPMFVNGCGTQHNNAPTTADDGENNQMVVITLNGANAISAQQKQVNTIHFCAYRNTRKIWHKT